MAASKGPEASRLKRPPAWSSLLETTYPLASPLYGATAGGTPVGHAVGASQHLPRAGARLPPSAA
eukprot:7464558-Alexandrium_andersonii.AAC.1